MYTYNIFCYGHRIADNEEFNEFIGENDLVFRETTILGKKYEVSTPYHGGASTYPIIFGAVITDDDNNPYYIDEVRSADEKDYEQGYAEFLQRYINDFNLEDFDDMDSKEKQTFEKLFNYLKTTPARFYSVEASS